MVEWPSGTVTFFFTAVVRTAIEDHHGHVVKTTGDGFHAVFADAPALTAAVAGQVDGAVVRASEEVCGRVSMAVALVRLMGDNQPEPKETPLQYMLLIHQGTTPTPLDPEAWATLSEAEQQAIYQAYQEINQMPGVTPGNGLQPPETATTVRVADGKILTTDGPFVGVKEALNGYLIYEADDLDAAIALAARIPAARLGGAIEVRPIMEW